MKNTLYKKKQDTTHKRQSKIYKQRHIKQKRDAIYKK